MTFTAQVINKLMIYNFLKKVFPWLLFLMIAIGFMKIADYAVGAYDSKLTDTWQEFFAQHDCQLAEVFISIHRRGWICDDGIMYYIDDPKFETLPSSRVSVKPDYHAKELKRLQK